jgi:TIR domain
LASRKAVDLRQFASCWLSEPLPPQGLPVRRLLCFEPAVRGRAPELVGDVFRSIVPFLTDHPPIRSIALPLLASGDQGEPREAMLESILTAALHWLEAGLALDTIKIVLREASATPSLQAVFRRIKEAHYAAQQPAASRCDYDLFVSYAHKDQEPVDVLLANLRLLLPTSRLFVDRFELNPGAAWQQHIFEALDRSRRVLCCLSPHYLASKVCIEEFNIAMIRSRNDENCELIPLYLRSASLPTYMTLFQFDDVREGQSHQLQHCAHRLSTLLGSG